MQTIAAPAGRWLGQALSMLLLPIALLWAPCAAMAGAGQASPPDDVADPSNAPALAGHHVPIESGDQELPSYLAADDDGNPSAAYDPWERQNRRVYRFNRRLDRAIVRPLASAYVNTVPRGMRDSLHRALGNLRQPAISLDLLMGGKPGPSIASLGRFALNLTVGIGGLFDPATAAHLPQYDDDFGQTLAHWGWQRSRYLMLPFFGPGTVRDRLGMLVDMQVSPYRYVQPAGASAGLFGVASIDARSRALALDDLVTGTDDDYALLREAWSQHRQYVIQTQAVAPTNHATRKQAMRP